MTKLRSTSSIQAVEDYLPQSTLRWLLLVFALYWASRVLWGWLVYPKYFSPLRHLPQPPGGSFLGHSSPFLSGRPGEIFRSWAEGVPNDGIIRYLDLFNRERIVVLKPAALADVLVHRNYDFEKPSQLRKGISRILGLGLALAEGEVHKSQRKNLMPAFAFRHVKNLYPTFWAKARELVLAITKDTELGSKEGSVVEVGEWASRSTLDIIGVAGMGRDFNAIANPENDLFKIYQTIFRPSRAGQLLGVLGFFLPGWVVRNIPFKRNNDINEASQIIRRHCASLIAHQKQQFKDETHSTNILSVALGSGIFSNEDLTDQLMTFLVAGHETTASALTWVVYLLCRHPDVQCRLREEILAAIPDQACEAQDITATVIDNLPYLQAVCNEALRLFPPVLVTIRVSVRDTRILGQKIPKGTVILIPPWAVNATRELWGGDATEFKPDRWLKSDKATQSSNYSFLTFLHGPRSCIGEKFARAELACLVAAWVGAFDSRLADEEFVLQVGGGITTKPKTGLPVRVKPVL